jgi:hypothetical protein
MNASSFQLTPQATEDLMNGGAAAQSRDRADLYEVTILFTSILFSAILKAPDLSTVGIMQSWCVCPLS